MSSKDEFEERLRRIQQSRGGTPTPAMSTKGQGDWQMPAPAGRRGGIPVGIVLAGIVSLGSMTFAALYFFAHLGLSVPFSAQNEVTAGLSGQSATIPQPGLLDRLFGTGLARDRGGDPIAYLPAAPVGWLRVTTDDAQMPDVMAQLGSRWPVTDGTLEAHSGYDDLMEFIRVYDVADIEQRVLSEQRTRALYLGPEDQILSLRLEYRSGSGALGDTGAPATWAKALETEVRTAAQLGETVEALDLDGIPVFNRAPQGQAGAARRGGIAPLDLSAALDARAVVQIRGTAQPAAAMALLKGIDRAALSNRLAQP